MNLRFMDGWDGGFEEQWTVLADLRSQGLVGDLGLSNCTPEQVKVAQDIAPVAMVQNAYNVVHREDDDFVDALAEQGIYYVPFFPLGGFSPLARRRRRGRRDQARRDAHAGRAGLAAAALAQHPADPRHQLGRPPRGEPRGRSTSTRRRGRRHAGRAAPRLQPAAR